MSISYSLVVTCWERADLLAPLYVMFSCFFFCYLPIRYHVLGNVWYLIVSIPGLCFLLYFAHGQYAFTLVRLKSATLFYLDSSILPLGTALPYFVVITMKVSDYCYDLGVKGLGQIYLTNVDVNSFLILARGCLYIPK